MKHQNFWLRLIGLVVMLGLLSSAGGAPVQAQDPQPPQPSHHRISDSAADSKIRVPVDGANYEPGKGWYVQEEAVRGMKALSPLDSGGPDEFGYTWDDSETYNWNFDPATWQNTGLTASNDTAFIDLPFPFKYYENSYYSVQITAYGYLNFSWEPYVYWPGEIPDPSWPNNIIAPYWVPTQLGSSGSTNQVFYTSGGSAPDRWFAVVWNQVKQYPLYGDTFVDNYTFEVILYENGDIVFQYNSINNGDGSWCASAGIENSTGMIGLKIMDFCGFTIIPPKAYRFHRPPMGARVLVTPSWDSRLVGPDEKVDFLLSIENVGDLGPDSFDLTSLYGDPPVEFFNNDGLTPIINTGDIAPGETRQIIARVQSPLVVGLGQTFNFAVQVTSRLSTDVSKRIELKLAGPAPFAQVFTDMSDGVPQLELSGPGFHKVVKAAPDSTSSENNAVIETPNGTMVYAWSNWRSLNPNYNSFGNELQYTLIGHDGGVVRPVTTLADLSGVINDTDDLDPALAVTPDGKIGVLWMRSIYKYENNQYLYNQNIYFAVLDANGNRILGPQNLTNNTSFNTWSANNLYHFSGPTLAATGDNRFVMAWRQFYWVSNGFISDVYFSIRDSGGNLIKAVTKFTADDKSYSKHAYEPNLATLSNNRVLLSWGGGDGDVHYALLNSAGVTIKGDTNLLQGVEEYYSDDYPDAVQLSNGNTLIAWIGDSLYESQIGYALLDGNFNRIAGPYFISNPPDSLFDLCCISVTSDLMGHGIFTWMDDNGPRMYYGIYDANTGAFTGPISSQYGRYALVGMATSRNGYANTTYKSPAPTTNAVDLYVNAPLMIGVPPGGEGVLPIEIGNHGLTQASNVTFSMDLGSSLTLVEAPPGYSKSNTVYSWNFSSMPGISTGKLKIKFGIPDSLIGTKYPIQLSISYSGADANINNNTATVNVMSSLQLFVPVITR
jgi:hypothetical protein